MTERIVADARVADRPGIGDQHLAADGRPQGVDQVGGVHRCDPREEVVIDTPASHRRDADDGLRVLRQGDDPGEQHVAERRGQAAVSRLVTGTEQLLDEERVPIRAPVDLVGEIVAGRRAEDGR